MPSPPWLLWRRMVLGQVTYYQHAVELDRERSSLAGGDSHAVVEFD